MMDLRTADITVGELAKLYERIAALEAELAPWRRMMAQLNELFNADYTVSVETEMGGFSVVAWPNNPEIVDPVLLVEVNGMTMPAAVAAAYEQVGVSDE